MSEEGVCCKTLLCLKLTKPCTFCWPLNDEYFAAANGKKNNNKIKKNLSLQKTEAGRQRVPSTGWGRAPATKASRACTAPGT